MEVYGPNGFFQKFFGYLVNKEEPEITLDYDHDKGGIAVSVHNPGDSPLNAVITSNAYAYGGPWSFKIDSGETMKKEWRLKSSGNWYDFSVKVKNHYLRRFAGRVETDRPSVSDPAMAMDI